MAIFHLHVKNISRAKGQNSVASSAYRSGEKLTDEKTGKEFDYTHKEKILHSEVFLPNGAPSKFYDRGKLWNAVERKENRKDARLGKEIEGSLPNELTDEQNLELAMRFCKTEITDKYGVIGDFSYHNKNGNKHFHYQATTREIKDGKFGCKIRGLDSRDFVNNLRIQWEKYVNDELKRYNIDSKIDHRSYKERGLEIVPTIHEGWKARRMEKLGLESDRINHNRRVKYWNLKHRNLISSRKNLISSQKDLIGDRNNINDSFTKEAQKCGKILDKISKGTLKNMIKSPVSKVMDQLKKLFQMALAGNQEAADVLGFHFSRVPELAENYGTPWEWLTELQKSEEKEKRFWRSIDDY